MKSFLKISFLFSFVVVFYFKLGCLNIPDKLVAPSWDVNLSVPIMNRTYTLDEIIKQQNYLSIQHSQNGGNIYMLQTDKFTQSVPVSKFIQINDSSSVQNFNFKVVNNDSSVIYFPMPQNVSLDSAVFTSGSLKFNFQNKSNVQVLLFMMFPGIIQSDGSVFNSLVTITPGYTSSLFHNLSGEYYKIPANQTGSNRDKLEVIVKAFVAGTADINMDFTCSALNFSYASGILPQKSLGVFTQNFVMDLGSVQGFREKTNLKNASLKIDISYISKLKKMFSFEIKNLNIIGLIKNGAPVYLTDSLHNQNLSILVQNGNYSFNFTKDNGNITEFISSLPDQIKINAEYVMNPDGSFGEASIYDAVRLQTEFSTSSYISINNASITDTANIDLSNKDRDEISKSKNASITLEVSNGIPLADSLKILFIDSLGNELFSLKNANGNNGIYLAGANVSSDGEQVASNAISTSTVVLNSSEIEKFSRAKKMIYTIKLSTSSTGNTNIPAVAIRPEYQISIKAYGTINYNLSPK